MIAFSKPLMEFPESMLLATMILEVNHGMLLQKKQCQDSQRTLVP